MILLNRVGYRFEPRGIHRWMPRPAPADQYMRLCAVPLFLHILSWATHPLILMTHPLA